MHFYINGILQLNDYDFIYSKNKHIFVVLNELQKGDNLVLEFLGSGNTKLKTTLKIKYLRKPVKYIVFDNFLNRLN